MKCKDLFALGVRLFGVWLITRGVTHIESFADVKLYPTPEKSRDSPAGYFIYATIDFALAAFFLLWTRVIVAWSYGEDNETANQVTETGAENPTGGSIDERDGIDKV